LQLADNQAMPLPPPPTRRHSNKANNELLFKGVLCALIGLAVLVSPYFITSAGMQGIVAQSSLVGWFALALGAGFIAVYLRRRLSGKTGPSGPL
jgi:VIT1/CCC1 family predicted Fe2+/Mn2+ transporter